MARSTPGLTDDQVAALRTAAAGTRKPRVRLLGTQFGDDATGAVLAVGDPATDGDEFISVRVKIGSVTDMLTMGPTELAMPVRGGRAGKAAAPKPAAPKSAIPKSATTKQTAPRQPTPQPPAAKPAAPKPAAPKPAAPKPTATKQPTPQQPSSAARRPSGKRKAPASVTVTLSSSGHDWKLVAMRGGRSLVKATPLAPGVVTAMADLVAEPALQQAVAEINDQSLLQARERADQLRDELAAVESLLQAHERPGQ